MNTLAAEAAHAAATRDPEAHALWNLDIAMKDARRLLKAGHPRSAALRPIARAGETADRLIKDRSEP